MDKDMDTDTKKGRRAKKRADDDDAAGTKRRCISSACVPCRRRKSKCDGTTPACSACAAVYNTPCVYDPNSDHRRKGVYKKDLDGLKTRNSTLHTLVQAILNYPESDVAALVRQIRTCESLDAVADAILARENRQAGGAGEGDAGDGAGGAGEGDGDGDDIHHDTHDNPPVTFESQLSGKMGELRLEDGSTRYIGGTSHLIYTRDHADATPYSPDPYAIPSALDVTPDDASANPFCSWTSVTADPDLVQHLIRMYFCWHYSFFTTLSKNAFLQEFHAGKPPTASPRKTHYCTPLLVNAMLALGCHFTSLPAARAVRDDSATAGDHFFREAKRLILEEDLHEIPALPTVQALALMSVREAGCGREAKGWVYSGMSFRMACDLGLNLGMHSKDAIDETEEDARRITFWGCFLFDKCWSNYLGRMPQLANNIITVPKFDVFPGEDAETWSAYTDSGVSQAHSQPSRTRAVALQISKLCEISSDLMQFFYNPTDMDKAKGKQAELKKLSEIHMRLETWRRELPKELEPKEGGLPHMLVMHMFFQLLYIHLFRPFLKYNPDNSPLPPNVSPRKQCTQAAAMISKLLRLYKRSHGLRQICNICVYIAHSACTIHLLNLPEKNAKRDIIHGIKHLEEIAEGWLCARRTLGILSVLARRWNVELPDEAAAVLTRTDSKFGPWNEVSTPKAVRAEPAILAPSPQEVSLQSYMPDMTNVATVSGPAYTYHTSAQTSTPYPRAPSSLPPTSIPHTRLQRHPSDPQNHPTPNGPMSFAPATPASHHPSTDGLSSAGASPSQLFGGVDQLIREGRDWMVRDQSLLASGFDNWAHTNPNSNHSQNPSQNIDEVMSWFGSDAFTAGGGGIGVPGYGVQRGGTYGPGTNSTNGINGGNGVNGVNGVNVNVNDVDGLDGMAGLQGFTYDERSWYDYQ